ncbi:dual specificity protein phosphatase family protein [Winogradskyella litoriviva]|uniref:Dual specificity protein phosphatase family protein n=1 Tax=Winogradskyella litoriviva TaxID=1220182 RepID=A0ABX2E2A9_9FLAO|nr:dual specificity protein phosphatase family protein [Winogradskyella litoriviva]NRD22634.1 dual specificity protein phosphatase family protein [Winogradskyella litoriviva]
MFRLFLFSIIFIKFGYAQDKNITDPEASHVEIESKYFNNLYSINDSILRSEQPSKSGFKELETAGVKTIINLRRLRDDNKKAEDTNLQLEHLPLATKQITEDDIIEVLKLITSAEKPILIHCWHGSDRTGVMVAAYRIVVENWTKEDAINEFRIDKFGYHQKKYPNLISLLENMDVDTIKNQLFAEN